jgi:hypothetical protein
MLKGEAKEDRFAMMPVIGIIRLRARNTLITVRKISTGIWIKIETL